MSKKVNYSCDLCGLDLGTKNQNSGVVTDTYTDEGVLDKKCYTRIHWFIHNDDADMHICKNCRTFFMKKLG